MSETQTTETPLRTYVDPCPGMKGSDVIVEICGKCSGDGVVNWGNVNMSGYVRGRRTNGARICFDCDGAGEIRTKVSSKRATARRQVKRHNEAVAKMEASDARVNAWREQWKGLAETLDALRKIDEDLAVSFTGHIRKHGELTTAQIDYMVDTLARHEEREAAKAAELEAQRPVVEGRGVITGEVLTVREQEEQWGYQTRLAFKVLVRDDRGFKVWGNLPKDLQPFNYYDENGAYQHNSGAVKGDRVTFTATVVKSERDECFGFFSRPVKASKLS